MKTAVNTAKIIASDELESSVMGMDAKGMDMATYFFRDKIYSNKTEAVVREYICNALDENKKFGVTEPVRFGLRSSDTDGKTEFFVRDNAKGLDEDGVRSIFGMYFRSTKSNSNDSIGGFGVGSKAGHAYTDSFNIVSHHNGEKTTYVCALGGGDNGVPVGHIYKMDSEPTKETGIEVNLEVSTNDFPIECYKFMAKSHGNIEFHNGNTVHKANMVMKEVTKDGFVMRVCELGFDGSNKLGYNTHQVLDRIHIKMGDVSYGCLKERSGGLLEGFSTKENFVASIECPMGSLDIPVSREGIRETPKNTKVIEKATSAFREFLKDEFKEWTEITKPEMLAKALRNEKSDRVERLGTKYFHSKFKTLLGDTGNLINNVGNNSLSKVTKLSEVEHDAKTKKPLLVLIPASRTSDYWRDKITHFEKLSGKKYFVYKCAKWQKNIMDDKAFLEEIEKDFTVINPKKLPYPKNSTKTVNGKKVSNKLFAVYRQSNRLQESHDALSLHNHIMGYYGQKEAKTLKLAKKQVSKILKNLESKSLEWVTLSSEKSTYNSSGYSSNFYVGAKALKEGMAELGYLTNHDTKHSKLSADFRDMDSKKLEMNRVIQILEAGETKWFSEKSKKLIKNNARNQERIYKVIKAMKQDVKSLKSLFLQDITGSWYNKFREVSRDEVRKVLRK